MNKPMAIVSASVEAAAVPRSRDYADAAVDGLAGACLNRLRDAMMGLDAPAIVEAVLCGALLGNAAVLSSFGADSAVLLHVVSRIDPHVPILFVDTGRMFAETLAYRDCLRELLGLTDVRTVGPAFDCSTEPGTGTDGGLRRADMCCYTRKVVPLARALGPFSSIITGRKRFQTKTRATMDVVELFDGRFRFNPLAPWMPEELEAYVDRHRLPRHPLAAHGYSSIGCREPCTLAVGCRSYSRAGRWPGRDKEECGIHGLP